jgi:membrane protein
VYLALTAGVGTMNVKAVGNVVKDAGSQWVEDKAARLGAALAYYTVFSIAPLLILAITIAGLIFGREAAQGRILEQVNHLVGNQGGDAIRSMLESASQPRAGIVGGILGIAMLLFGAAGLFGQLQDAMNTIWEVEPKPGRGVWGFLQDRFLSLTMVLGLAFLLLVSLLLSAAVAALVRLFGSWQTGLLGYAVNEFVSFLVVTAIFAMIFKFLPDAKIAWRDVWLGAALTSLLFVIGKFGIGYYVGHSGTASAYGAAGSLAVLLVWLYYSAQIFLYGAELTKVYAMRYGSRIAPAENAVPVTEEARAQQGMAKRDGRSSARPAARAS